MENIILNMIMPLAAIVLAITIHEFAHAWTAFQLGDPTAKKAGRISLNPVRHIDPLGFIAFLLLHFGWGKPVPVNVHNLKNPRRDNAIVSFAGPFSNFITAAVFAIPLKYLDPGLLYLFINQIIGINLVLMVFNLIPMPPLDGGAILFGILPKSCWKVEDFLERNGPFILIGVIILDRVVMSHFQISLIGTVIGGGVDAAMILIRSIS